MRSDDAVRPDVAEYVYSAIARALPLEGRDYEVEITGGDSPRLRMRGLTRLGEVFISEVEKSIRGESNGPEPESRCAGEVAGGD